MAEFRDPDSAIGEGFLEGAEWEKIIAASAADAKAKGQGQFAKAKEPGMTFEFEKIDEAKRLVYGWASVIEKDGKPVVDWQGDVITEADLVKAVHEFNTEYREGKTMHKGAATGETVESMVFTHDVQKSLGIDLGKVGWFICYKVHDDATWSRVVSKELRAFSIGGTGQRVALDGEA